MQQKSLRTTNLKTKSWWAIALGLAAIVLLSCVIAWWLNDRTPTPAELLQPLTVSQRQCVEQIINGRTLIYLTQHSFGDSVAVGYTGDNDLYVAVISEDQSNGCHTEYNEKVFDCYQHYLPEYCTNNKLRLQKVEAVELTGDATAEMYVWVDVQGVGRRSNAKHQFYVRQSDGSFTMVLELRLCAGLGSVEINKDSQKIIATDDMNCYMFFQGRKEYIEYILPKGTPQKLRDDFDPL
jgi:hypothetical protein